MKFHSTSSYSYESRRIQCVLWKVQLAPVAATLKRRIAGTLHEEVPTCISGCILVRWTRWATDQESLHICQLHNKNITTLDCTLERYFHVFQPSENHLKVIRHPIRYKMLHEIICNCHLVSLMKPGSSRATRINGGGSCHQQAQTQSHGPCLKMSEAILVPRFDNKERGNTNKDLDHFNTRTN